MLTLTKKSKQTKRNHRKGFTVIELIVVIAVIGILASITVVSYGESQKRAQKSSYESNAQQVKLRLGDYFTDNNKYPVTKSDIVTYLSSTGSTSLSTEFSKAAYTYAPTTNTGVACSTTVPCEKYTITVAKTNWRGGSTDADIIVTP